MNETTSLTRSKSVNHREDLGTLYEGSEKICEIMKEWKTIFYCEIQVEHGWDGVGTLVGKEIPRDQGKLPLTTNNLWFWTRVTPKNDDPKETKYRRSRLSLSFTHVYIYVYLCVNVRICTHVFVRMCTFYTQNFTLSLCFTMVSFTFEYFVRVL